MELMLIRHGIAEPSGPLMTDFDRPLTEEGRRRFSAAVAGFLDVGLGLDVVLHSPLVRATQTAQLLAPLVAGDEPREQIYSMQDLAQAPGAALFEAVAKTAQEALGEDANNARIALVGHEPWMSEICALALTARRDAVYSLPFKKGGMALMQGQPRQGGYALKAFIPPRMGRHLGPERIH